MFGADTPLVIDALQMAAVAAAIGAGGVFLALKMKRKGSTISPKKPKQPSLASENAELKGRVETLERIITDPSIRVAQQIEALRDEEANQHSAEERA